MPKTGLKLEFEVKTRKGYGAKAKAELSLTVDGRELPNMGILGEALEAATQLIEQTIEQSFEVVPPRIDTPMVNTAQPTQAQPVMQTTPEPPAPKPVYVPFGE